MTSANYDTCETYSDATTSDSTCTVTVEAVAPASGWRFDHWTGDCTGTTATCTMTSSDSMCDYSGPNPPCTSNEYQLAAVAHFVDTRAPTLTFDQAPAASSVVFSASQAQQFTFHTDEDAEVPVYQCRKDAGAFAACSSGSSWSGIPDGVHDFCVQATDASGLASAIVCRHWEQEQPVTVEITSGPPATTSTPDAAFTYTSDKAQHVADGSTMGYDCSLDGAAFAACPAAGKSYSLLANGGHTFTVRVSFSPALGSGAVTASSSESWTQADTTGPEIDVTGPSGVVVDPGRTATISWQLHDSADATQDVTYMCAVDSIDYAPCTSPLDLAGLTDGVHTVHLYAKDFLGNQGSGHRVQWDQEVPAVTSIDSGRADGSTSFSRSATFRFSAAKDGVRFQCKHDARSWGPCSGSGSDAWKRLSFGRHTFAVRAVFTAPLDGSVHRGPAVSRTWTVRTPVRITKVQYNGPGPDRAKNKYLNREWVRVTNVSTGGVQLKGWTVRDADGHVYRIGSLRLAPGKSVLVHTGSGRDTATDRYWGSKKFVWGNSHDTARLRTPDGLTASVCRWTKAGTGSITC